MSLTVAHRFVSGKSDSPDTSLINPSNWNDSHVISGLPYFYAPDYIFTPQTPGGSLSIGSNTITVAPVPPGVNGTDSFHYLYISGGSGTAEAVLITGGTAVAGNASGTLIVTCANTHSGAWTLSTATGGLQEAMLSLPAGGGCVIMGVATSANFHAKCTYPSVRCQVIGQGTPVASIWRAEDYANGDLLELSTLTAGGISGMRIQNNTTASQTSGAAIRVPPGIACFAHNLEIDGGYIGIDVDGDTATLYADNLQIDFSTVGRGLACLYFHSTANDAMPEAWITNSLFITTAVAYCVFVTGVDQLQFSNCEFIGGLDAINFQVGNSPNYIASVSLGNCIIESTTGGGISVASGNTGSVLDFHFSEVFMTGIGTTGYAFGPLSSESVYNVVINGGSVVNCGLNGLYIGINVKTINVSGVTFDDNNSTNTGYYGIYFDAGFVGRATFTGVVSGNYNGGHQVYGMLGAGAVSNITVTGCDFTNNGSGGISIVGNLSGSSITGNNLGATAPLTLGGTVTTSVIKDNQGLDNVFGSVASGTTITAPLNPQTKITGTTTTTTINGGWLGRTLVLVKTDTGTLAVGGGGNIPVAVNLIAASNPTRTLIFDGTNWY